jgi:hypothetical protein
MVFLCTAVSAEAATLYFDPSEASINPGDTIAIGVRINTNPDECINVVDAVIEYDPAIQPVDISRGQSILPLWVEEPRIDRENNRITFAGGIPNGYCGRVQGDPRLTNEVLKIIFQVPGLRIGYGEASPTSTIRFTDETAVYLNDGAGTLAQLLTVPASIGTTRTPGETLRNDWSRLVNADGDAPEEFSISLIQDDSIFSGSYYIVFNTTDKQTGIAYYEIMEEPLGEAGLFAWGAVDAPWVEARSPYVLKDQSLNSTIRVRAVDKAGNEYVATLVPEDSLRSVSYATYLAWAAVAVAGLLVLILLILLGVALRRRLRERRAAHEATDNHDEDDALEDYDEDEQSDDERSQEYDTR